MDTTFNISEAQELLNDLETALIVFDDSHSNNHTPIIERTVNFIHDLIENEGWIEWKGGKFPLPSDRTEYQARYRDGIIGNWTDARRAGKTLWEHSGGPADIVAYRRKSDIVRVRETSEKVVPDGWVVVPTLYTLVKANHPITVLNPTETFQVEYIKFEGGKFWVRGENTCWFNVDGGIEPV